jgi:transcription initiation factor TFIIB
MDSLDKIDQELDDILLDDLVDAQNELSDTSSPGTLTPGQAVYADRREDIVTSEIARLAEELGIGESTQTMAKTLFDQFVSKEDVHGYALEVLAAACLYTACKVESVPLSPDDFAAAPKAAFTRVILLRRVKKISSTLGLDPSAFFDPHAYIDRYCDELGISAEITARAHQIIDIADDAGIGGGKSPTGRAAAAIYNATIDYGRRVTQRDIAKVAGVTEVTIRNRYQDQRELLTEDTISPMSNGQKEVSRDGSHEMGQYIGDGVAENIATALNQLSETTEELEAKTWKVCQCIGDSQAKKKFKTDDVTLALAAIRFASEELEGPIPYPTLKKALEGGNDKIYRVRALVADNVQE